MIIQRNAQYIDHTNTKLATEKKEQNNKSSIISKPCPIVSTTMKMLIEMNTIGPKQDKTQVNLLNPLSKFMTSP